MDELGTILRETRQARGLTLEQVTQVTRIRPRFLEALEEGRYDALPTPVHVRGFLRNYALFLNLDPEPLLARFKAGRRAVEDIPLQKQVRPELAKKPLPPLQTLEGEVAAEPVFYRPLGNRLRAPAWFSLEILVAGLLLVVLLALVAWVGGRFVIPAITGGQATETAVAQVTTTRPVTTPSRPAVVTPTLSAKPPVQEPTVPPIVSSIQLEVTVLERTWLLVEVDGDRVQEGMAQVGQLFAWSGAELVKIRTGNGAGLSVTLNGRNLGALGARGQVVERIWGLAGEIPPTPMPTATPAATAAATPEA